jgi:DNA-binding transcriptional LysR family regulator
MELGTLEKAAEKLHISQPALTKSIKRLEEQLGVRLFERGSPGMKGTVYAETLRPFAPVRLLRDGPSHHGNRCSQAQYRRTVTVAGPSVVVAELFPETIVRLSAQRPKLQIRVVSHDQMLCSSLLSGEFGLVAAPFYNGSPKPGLIRNWVFDDELVVITRPEHPPDSPPRGGVVRPAGLQLAFCRARFCAAISSDSLFRRGRSRAAKDRHRQQYTRGAKSDHREHRSSRPDF